MSLPYNKSIIPKAKELRKKMLSLEKHLWYDHLSAHPVRFQRKKVINNYIADFYCHKARLIIELDGLQHYMEEGHEYDSIHTEILETYGLDVIHITIPEIERDFKGVCNRIDVKIMERMQLESFEP